jgi:hypothetical protein
MAEHFTKTTIEAKFWCAKCGGPTMHYVFDGRRGGCQECIKRLEQLHLEKQSEPPKPTQGFLF